MTDPRMTDPKDGPATSPWSTKKPKPLANPGVHDPVTPAAAVAFIVRQLNPTEAELRSVDDAVRHRVAYALKRHKLRSDNGVVLFGDLVAWGLEIPEWRDALAGFPSLHYASGAGSMAPLFGQAHGYTVPVGEEAKDAALREAHVRIRELEDAMQAQAEELIRLRPLQAKHEQFLAEASKNGKMGGRGRTR